MADRTKRQEVPTVPARADVLIDDVIVYAGASVQDARDWLKREKRSGSIREWQPWR